MSRARVVVIACVALAIGVLVFDRVVGFEEVVREVTLPLRHEDSIRQQAEERNLDAALIAAVIYAESRFRAQTSEAGARGLMQVTPETAKAIAEQSGGVAFEVGDLDNSDINIRYGTYHLRDLLDQYDGNLIAALAAYNAGSGNVDEWGGASLVASDIAFPETRAYVDQVLEKREQYRESYAEELGL